MTKRDPLLGKTDKFLADLMAEAADDTVVEGKIPIDFRDRIALLSAATRYLAVKHKVEPDGEGEDFLGTARRELGAAPGKARDHKRGAGVDRTRARGPDTIPLNPPAPAGRAVAVPNPDGNHYPGAGAGDNSQKGSDFWRAPSNGAGVGGPPDAAAGAGGRNGAGGHGDE
jgi:hypothetical protein